MSQTVALHTFLHEERLAPYAVSAAPAWLWAADASRMLWANAAGATLFGETSPITLAQRRFNPAAPAAREISRLGAALPTTGNPQLSRLRGFSGTIGRPVVCSCSRMMMADGTAAILVAAIEDVGPDLSLAERARRLFADDDETIAVFAPSGPLLHAGSAAADWLAGHHSLQHLDAEDIATRALLAGTATGDSARGPLMLHALGAGDAVVLLATFAGLAAPIGQHDAAVDEREEPVISETDQNSSANAVSPVEAKAETKEEDNIDMIEPEEMTMRDEIARDVEDVMTLPAAAEPASAPEPHALPAADLPAPDLVAPARRHPLRFVWQMDAAGHFTISSDEFVAIVGPRSASLLGRPWSEIASALGIDTDGRIARAITSRDTWSGITIAWPVDGSPQTVHVALSGLPTFGRDRVFAGYRGFGVLRENDATPATRAVAPVSPEHGGAPTRATSSVNEPSRAQTPTPEKPPTVSATIADPPIFAEGRPQLTVVPAAKNVVPFRGSAAPAEKRPALTTVERNAFQEIARALGVRQETESTPTAPALPADEDIAADAEPAPRIFEIDQSSDPDQAAIAADDSVAFDADVPPDEAPPSAPDAEPVGLEASVPPPAAYASALQAASAPPERVVLDRIPVAVLAYRVDRLLYANRAFFDWSGFQSLEELQAAGGFDRLFADAAIADGRETPAGQPVAMTTRDGGTVPIEARLFTMPWEGETALLLMLEKVDDTGLRAAERAIRAAEAEAEELKSILDTATDGVIVTDSEGRILSANRSAQALFGYDAHELIGGVMVDLFAPESHRDALDYLDGLLRSGVASILNDGREVIGRARGGGLIPLFMTMGRVSDHPTRLCAVFRDITQWKRAEEELVTAKREAEKASSAKSDFLAKISHEIRTPLNAIIGFTEVMTEQRFGPIGNERYVEYLQGINTSGSHLIALVNDLLDLSKIEAGKLDLAFARVDVNVVTQEAVAIMQPQANRERIIIRTSLSASLPPVVADAHSIRQIALNLISNSIKYTGAGGQVIVSTAFAEAGEAVLRVRDTGVGMSEKDIALALEPFRQLATSSRTSSARGAGLGLPLTKALTEANRATFSIKSAVNSGTLVEIVFPATRVLSE